MTKVLNQINNYLNNKTLNEETISREELTKIRNLALRASSGDDEKAIMTCYQMGLGIDPKQLKGVVAGLNMVLFNLR